MGSGFAERRQPGYGFSRLRAQTSMDYGSLILSAVFNACQAWGLSEYTSRSDYQVLISGAPGQVFEIEIKDERDEATIWIVSAGFHTHLDQTVEPEVVVRIIKDLLTGVSYVETRYRGRRLVESQILGDYGAKISFVSFNPFHFLLPERTETVKNEVKISF